MALAGPPEIPQTERPLSRIAKTAKTTVATTGACVSLSSASNVRMQTLVVLVASAHGVASELVAHGSEHLEPEGVGLS